MSMVSSPIYQCICSGGGTEEQQQKYEADLHLYETREEESALQEVPTLVCVCV